MYIMTQKNPESLDVHDLDSGDFIFEASYDDAKKAIREIASKYVLNVTDADLFAKRSLLLLELKKNLENNCEALARLMSEEGNRPISACLTEAKRSVQTIEKTLYALKNLCTIRAHDFSDALQGGHTALEQHFTYGPLFAITPFNFPLNLALHKIAPALALDIPFVCKMPSKNPKTYALLHKILTQSGISSSSFVFLNTESNNVSPLLKAVPFPLISFTGSRSVGMKIKKEFWDRKVILELGGTAFAVFTEEGFTERWNSVKDALGKSAFGSAGQSCISLQHIVIPESFHTNVVEELHNLCEMNSSHKDACDEKTIVSPLVDNAAFISASDMVSQCKAQGFSVWQAGKPLSELNYYPPTLICVPRALSEAQKILLKREAFAPLVFLHTVDSDTSIGAMAEFVNDTFDANIHGSFFATSIALAHRFFKATLVRTVLWNEVPSWRADEMPYGGSASPEGAPPSWRSGLLGDEGPAQTLHEYTFTRLLVLP